MKRIMLREQMGFSVIGLVRYILFFVGKIASSMPEYTHYL